MINRYPIWVIIVSGAIFVVCLGMTLPIYFNFGGEIIFPIDEAHSQDYSNVLGAEQEPKINPDPLIFGTAIECIFGSHRII